MANKEFNDWNNVSNTKIPLNEEIFALLEDRMNPERLSPAVIVAKMMPSTSISWAESTAGDVLCYDIPIGNFHCCNGAEIKYWKYANIPDTEYEKQYEKLMCILSHLPTDTQEVIKDLASERARQYCDKYDNHLQDFKDAAYNYELSKCTRDAVYQSVMDGSVIIDGFRAIHEIKDYFTKKFDYVLNDYIQTRSSDTEFLREPPHEVIT